MNQYYDNSPAPIPIWMSVDINMQSEALNNWKLISPCGTRYCHIIAVGYSTKYAWNRFDSHGYIGCVVPAHRYSRLCKENEQQCTLFLFDCWCCYHKSAFHACVRPCHLMPHDSTFEWKIPAFSIIIRRTMFSS